MKKKREAKRQAKQQQSEDPNDDIQNTNKTADSVDNEKQLRIKKIQSVCICVYNLINNLFLSSIFFYFTGFKKYQSS